MSTDADDQTRPRFFHELKVRYADTDAQGHVFFANYLTFFDEGFTAYMHAIGASPKACHEAGCDFVYVDARCQYLGRSYFEDKLQVGCRIGRIGNTSFTASYLIVKGDPEETVATGTLTMVCVDAKSLEKIRVPDMLRDALAAYEAGG